MHIMACDKNRDAGLCHGYQQSHDLQRQGRVEVASGLVGNQYIGARDQGAGDTDPLLFAAG